MAPGRRRRSPAWRSRLRCGARRRCARRASRATGPSACSCGRSSPGASSSPADAHPAGRRWRCSSRPTAWTTSRARSSRSSPRAASSCPTGTTRRASPTRASRAAREAKDAVEWIRSLNRYVRRPDLTIVLDLQPDVAAERRAHRGEPAQLYEQNEVQRALAVFYRELAKHVPKRPHRRSSTRPVRWTRCTSASGRRTRAACPGERGAGWIARRPDWCPRAPPASGLDRRRVQPGPSAAPSPRIPPTDGAGSGRRPDRRARAARALLKRYSPARRDKAPRRTRNRRRGRARSLGPHRSPRTHARKRASCRAGDSSLRGSLPWR